MKAWFLKLPNNIRAAINTAWQSALTLFAVSLLGFLASVQQWAGDTSRPFPSVSPLGKAVGSAFLGLCVGVVTALFRWVKPGPVYPAVEPQVVPPAASVTTDEGYGLLVTIALVLGIILIVLLILAHVDFNTH